MIVISVLEDSLVDLDPCAESHPTSSLRDVAQKLSSDLKLSCFISRIYSGPSGSSHGNSSKTLCHIVTALCHLILGVDVEVLSELYNLCIEANSLLNCAATFGVEAKELHL